MTTTMGLVPEYATTPRRKAPAKPRKNAQMLLTYALEHGARIEKTPETYRALFERGFAKTLELVPKRLPHAICDLQKYYGQTITTEVSGTRVTAYVLADLIGPSAPSSEWPDIHSQEWKAQHDSRS